MDAVIYLEPDEEITSVIDKLKKAKSPIVGIVAPRNAILLQSIVNLKLLKKQATTLKKDISLVTADRIGQNLALRTGLTVYSNIHDTEPLPPIKEPMPDTFIEDDSPKPPLPAAGFRVHHYDERSDIVDASPISTDETDDEELQTDFASRAIGEMSTKQIHDDPEELNESGKASKDLVESPKVIKDEPVENKVEKKESKTTDFHSNHLPERHTIKVKPIKLIIILVIFLLIIGGIGYLALTSVSRATVNILVASEAISQPLDITVSKDRTEIDSNKNIIPGRLIESLGQATQKVIATGKKDIGTKATGKMTVTNETGISQSFEANTAFKSAANLIFRANKAFTVPAATPIIDNNGNVSKINGTATIDVTANEAGDNYNVSAASYSIAGYTLVHGQGGAMTGGATKQVTVISQGDIDKATTDITTDLYGKSLAELKKKAGDSVLTIGAIKNEVTDTTADAEVGAEVSDFNLTIKTKSSVLVYDNSNLNKLITQTLESKKPEDKSLRTTETKNLEIKIISSDPQNGIMKLSTMATGKIIPKLDEKSLPETLAGKTKSEVDSYIKGLSQGSDIKNVDTQFYPKWWLKKIPSDVNKVQITIQPQN